MPARKGDLRETLRASGIERVISSPARRCRRLADALGRPTTLDPRLQELDFGTWEGQPWDDVPRERLDAWAADLLHHRPGGAENVLHVARRVHAFVADLRAAGTPAALVICHAGTMRLLAALATNLPLEQAALQAAQTPHRIGYGEIVVLEWP